MRAVKDDQATPSVGGAGEPVTRLNAMGRDARSKGQPGHPLRRWNPNHQKSSLVPFSREKTSMLRALQRVENLASPTLAKVGPKRNDSGSQET